MFHYFTSGPIQSGCDRHFHGQVAAAGWTLPAVMLARGMVGLGEGVALPAMNNLVANNVPPARRSTALGGCFTGFHTGQVKPQTPPGPLDLPNPSQACMPHL